MGKYSLLVTIHVSLMQNGVVYKSLVYYLSKRHNKQSFLKIVLSLSVPEFQFHLRSEFFLGFNFSGCGYQFRGKHNTYK